MNNSCKKEDDTVPCPGPSPVETAQRVPRAVRLRAASYGRFHDPHAPGRQNQNRYRQPRAHPRSNANLHRLHLYREAGSGR
uniref:Uncharacterized protein n=1 Tax=Tanacetum cinerariifolium TaxID=118510 RepID=A0A699W522_TANCI|nr:hypothetical protein [Tanacetum cinerariifolium]